jgi:hypothetical protein
MRNINIYNNKITNGDILFTATLNNENLTLKDSSIKDNVVQITGDADYVFFKVFAGGTNINTVNLSKTRILRNNLTFTTADSRTIKLIELDMDSTVDLTYAYNVYSENIIIEEAGTNTITMFDANGYNSFTETKTIKKGNIPVETESIETDTGTTATAGAQTLPANPVGFLQYLTNNVKVKIAYYAD